MLEFWLSTSLLISFFTAIVVVAFALIFMCDTEDKRAARRLLTAVAVVLLSWTWPLVFPAGVIWIARSAWRVAEVEVSVPDLKKWHR